MKPDQLINNIRQMIALDSEEADYIQSIIKPARFAKRDYVFRGGEICHNASFVNSGCLKILYTDKAGTEHIVKFAVENWWVFDLASFTTRTPAFYSIQAIEETELLQLSNADYELLYERVPKFERFFRLLFQNSYIQLQHRLTQNLYANAEEKYRHFKDKYPGLEQRISQKEIAAYLGITPEFLSMLRKRRMSQPIS